MKKQIRFLNIEEFRVLKIIRIHGPDWNQFTGYLYYKRLFSKQYQSSSPDYIDEIILKSINNVYPKSTLVVNKNILFSGELNDILKGYTGGTTVDYTMRFTPDIPFEKINFFIGKQLHEYLPIFKLNLFLKEGDKEINNIRDFSIAYIPFEKINDFNKRIKTFDLNYN